MRVAVLGTGAMGSALIHAMLKRGAGEKVSVTAWDVNTMALSRVPSKVRRLEPSRWFVGSGTPDIVLIAVKPADVMAALEPLVEVSKNSGKTIWCSIAAGVPIARLEKILGQRRKICRVMPNTPAQVGMAASAFAVNRQCGAHDISLIEKMLTMWGIAVQIPEKLMNAVTGLSGSGPAYVYLFLEALIEGGVTAGLPHDIARRLAVQTLEGAARMAASSGANPADLKAAVMSPGGTTAAGLLALEEHGMKYGVIRAIVQATRRAEELAS